MIIRALTVLATIWFGLGMAQAKDCMNQDSYYWEGERRLPAYDTLMEFMQCKDYGDDTENALSDRTACNWFFARGLEALYGITDFTPVGGRWKSANEIAAEISSSANWEEIGAADDQAVLQTAADEAAAGVAVVAVQPEPEHGHVALVLGGPLSASGAWNLKVPNSASFRLDDIDKTYVGCKLSYAWQTPPGVTIYKRAN